MINQMDSLEGVSEALGRAAEGMQFQEASLAFFEEKGRLWNRGRSNGCNRSQKYFVEGFRTKRVLFQR